MIRIIHCSIAFAPIAIDGHTGVLRVGGRSVGVVVVVVRYRIGIIVVIIIISIVESGCVESVMWWLIRGWGGSSSVWKFGGRFGRYDRRNRVHPLFDFQQRRRFYLQ